MSTVVQTSDRDRAWIIETKYQASIYGPLLLFLIVEMVARSVQRTWTCSSARLASIDVREPACVVTAVRSTRDVSVIASIIRSSAAMKLARSRNSQPRDRSEGGSR